MGTVLLNLGKYEEALEFIDDALDIGAENAGVQYMRGIALLNLGRYEDALQSFDRALEINCEDLSFWIGRGNALGYLRRYEDALQSFDRALAIDSGNAGAWNGRGQALKFLERYEDALQSFDRALEINCEDSDVWFNEGETHLKIAVQEFERNNYGNALENVNSAIDSFLVIYDSKKKEVKEEITDFFRNLVDSRQIEAIDTSLKTISRKKEELTEFLRPILRALDIVKTGDLKKYYELQVEQRDIVADIVKRLTGSEELLPEEYRSN